VGPKDFFPHRFRVDPASIEASHHDHSKLATVATRGAPEGVLMKLTISPATAEEPECEAVHDIVAGVDVGTRRRLGIASLRAGGGLALSVRTDSTGFWNRALGFGFSQPVTHDLIARLTDFYRARGVTTATIQLAPPVIPADWDEIRARENLSASPGNAKLAREIDTATGDAEPGLHEGLRVGRTAPADDAEWLAVKLRAFELSDECSAALLASTVRRPGWHTYAAWHGDRIIATASLQVRGSTARLLGGTTLPEYRGQGVQTALIAARVQAARAAGCRWLVAETGAEGPDGHNSSLRNLRRAGFELLYERTDWIWHDHR
jgi:GNAT superfamily N-acetyltransferase